MAVEKYQLLAPPLSLNPLIIRRNNEANMEAETEEEEPLSPTARLFQDPQLNCYVLAMVGVACRIDADTIKTGLRETLIRHPRFSSKMLFDSSGGAKWVRTKVNLDEHVIVPDLDAAAILSPGDFIEDYVSSLSDSSLDLSKPLWELHILNLPTSEAEATAVFRIHHSLGDGVSLISLLLACTRRTSDPHALPTLHGDEAIKVKRAATKSKGLWRIWWSSVVWLITLLVMAWNTVVDVILFMATAVGLLRDSQTPIKAAAGPVKSRRRRIVHHTVSLEDLRVIKRATDATINDVVLGAVSAGLTQYMNRKCKANLPTKVRVRTTLMVNVRKTLGIHAFAEMMEQAKFTGQWGNWIGYVLVPFPIMQLGCPLEYVRRAKKIVSRKKSSMEALFTYMCANLVLKIFGPKAAASLWCDVLANTTFLVSNIPGPVEEISFYGHRAVYIAPTVYGIPQALCIHFQSYMDKMKIVLAVDESVIPDPHQLCDDLVESLNTIKNAALRMGLLN